MENANPIVPHRLSVLVIALICLLGAILRLERLNGDPLWHDEILSIVRMYGGNKATFTRLESSNRSLTGDALLPLIESTREGPERGLVYMPAFYFFERMFSLPFNDIRVGAKFFSFLCGALLPLVVAFIAFRLTESVVAPPLVAMFVALHPSLTAYSVEARPYSSLLLAISLYLYLLLSPSPQTAHRIIALCLVTVFGAFTHLLFLPIAWVGFLLLLVMAPQQRHGASRVAFVLLITSLAALPLFVSVLGTPEASNHFTSQPSTPVGVLRAASATLDELVGIGFPGAPSVTFGVMLLGIVFSLRHHSARVQVTVLTLIAPFLAMVAVDLIFGGIRSSVPRYSLTAAVAFALLLPLILDTMWARNRIVAMMLAVLLMSALIFMPTSINHELKGGRYDELAWYAQRCGERECLTLSTLPGSRAMEFASNSFAKSAIVPVSGYLPSPIVSQVNAAQGQGFPVLAIAPLDGVPPILPGGETRWAEDFLGAQTLIYRLVPRERQ
jgi:hypothetical protein